MCSCVENFASTTSKLRKINKINNFVIKFTRNAYK